MNTFRLPVALGALLAGCLHAVAADVPLVAVVERTDGTTISGTLAEVSPTAVVFAGQEPVAVAGVRRLVVEGEAGGGTVAVGCADGGTLTGDDFAWDGESASIVREEGSIELPVDRVRSVTLRSVSPATDGGRPDWRAALPESPQTDLVVVGRPEGGGERLEVVECAIAAVTAEAVTVLLDDERIPVKRAKVVGLWFLRDDAAAGGTRVEIVGGGLPARTVAWTPQALVVDGAVRMPAALLRAIDYAAGRTVRLQTIRPERSETEPFFGALGRIEALRTFFAARFVVDAAGPALLLRPRSLMVWRVPEDSRRFRTAVAVESGRQPSGETVTVLLDDREVFRRRIEDAAASPVDVDVSGGRRLAITVDFPAGGGPGCPLRFADPLFEK